MPSQIGETRLYTSLDEATDVHLKECDLCKVKAVPRGISTTDKHPVMKQDMHCPNCGHIHGRANH